MIALDYAGLQSTAIAPDPFAHLIVKEFVPSITLARVIAGLPVLNKGGSFPISSLPFSNDAAALMAQLEGPRFRSIVADRFGLDLSDAPTMVTLRGQSREKDGRIHCDSTAKRMTALLYLNAGFRAWQRQDGCLRLLRGPDDLENFAVEVPPTDGTLLVFPNGPTTWHGHRRYIGQRYVVQLNYMTNDNAARSELRRHRMSALIKRLVAA